MIGFPIKRLYGLVGMPRAGKDSVAQFLEETRGFVPMAFADRIKQECGISKEDFESAKIAGNIEELRQKLWDFSAEKKKQDSLYFVRRLMEDAIKSNKPVVVTDIRTPDELNEFLHYNTSSDIIRRIYWVRPAKMEEEYLDYENDADENDMLVGSKIEWHTLSAGCCYGDRPSIKTIPNQRQGLYQFFQELNNIFFEEEIMDLSDSPHKKINKLRAIRAYLRQFEVSMK